MLHADKGVCGRSQDHHNQALKHVGTRHRVIVHGGDRMLTSVPLRSSVQEVFCMPMLLAQLGKVPGRMIRMAATVGTVLRMVHMLTRVIQGIKME